MAEQPHQQFQAPTDRTFPTRGKVILLICLIILLILVGVILFTPVVPSTFRIVSNSQSPSTIMPGSGTTMFGLDAENTRVNTGETHLTYTNVSHLVDDWSSYPTGGSLFSSPVVTGGFVYVGSFDGRLYVFPAGGCGQAHCSPAWTSTPVGDRIFSTPAVANGVVYVGSYDHKLYAFPAAGCGRFTCAPIWTSTPTGNQIDASPTVAGGVVFIGSDDGRLYAFRASGCGQPLCHPLWTSIAPASNIP